MIQPALELVDQYRALYFIADYHALTSSRDPAALHRMIFEAAATWLALGLDPQEVLLYRQSDIPEVFELAWILSCFTPKGLLNRAHAYKAAVDANVHDARSADAGINAGLYNYPVLMAADILLFETDVVPVGKDQLQHVEIARDIAASVNATYGDVLKVPTALVREDTMTIPGLDGRKMSKSYQNTIPIFASPKYLRKQVMRITTDSKRPEDPKDPATCNVFAIYRHFAPTEAVDAWRQRYLQGGAAYSEIKEETADLLLKKFAASRRTFEALMGEPETIEAIFEDGATRARAIAQPVLARIRRRIGIEFRRK